MSIQTPSESQTLPDEPQAFVGRQPVYDRQLEVYAYELLYRSGESNQAQFVDGERATAEVLANSLADIGLERLIETRVALVNVTRRFLLSRQALSLPPKRVILEILEDVTVDQQLVDAVAELSAAGYQIALDDFVYAPELDPLVALADIVKVDVMALGLDASREHLERMRRTGPAGLKLLAEKVETRDEFEALLEMGFDYFQGFFLAKPVVVAERRLPPHKLAVLRLGAALQNPDVELSELEDLLERDVALTVKLFRFINSALYGLPKEVTSIRRAIVCLGLQQLKQVVTLIALSRIDDKPSELFRMALVRAKMSEQLALALGGVDADTAFTAGLFSALDMLLDAPLAEVVQELHLVSEIEAAVIGREGALGRIVGCAIAYERCDWPAVALPPCPAASIRDAYLTASEWSFAAYPDSAPGPAPG